MHFWFYMSRKNITYLSDLKKKLKRSQVDIYLLTRILRRPRQYIVDRLDGIQHFTLKDLLSIADLIGCDISDIKP